jgi:hypothetical protein
MKKMPKPIDMIPGMSPTRKYSLISGEDKIKITVQAPPFMEQPPRSVVLSCEQYERYLTWLNEGVLIQDALPDLSSDDREILISGLGPDLGGLVDG